MVLSHPSGTLEKKSKKVKEKRKKKKKRKKRKCPWGPNEKKKRVGFLEGSERSAFAFFSFHLALRPNEKKNALGF